LIRSALIVSVAVLVLGCASSPGSKPPSSSAEPQPGVTQTGPEGAPAKRNHFEGRISVNVKSDPPQYLSAPFEIDGDIKSGELKLYGPLGGLAMMVQWEPDRAVLIEGERRRVVPSLDWLLERVTGAKLPVSLVFDLLSGQPVQSDDWWIEPRNGNDKRLRVVRMQPLPQIELTLLLKNSTP
jgi:outer membrane lipoprotein LolB